MASMVMKNSTRDKYVKFFQLLNNPEAMLAGHDLRAMCRNRQMDMNIMVFLKDRGLVKTEGDTIISVQDFAADIDALVTEYALYRNKRLQQSTEDKELLQYYKENKDFLVDKRNLPPTISADSINRIRREVTEQVAGEIATYAELAIQLKKEDIKGFILALLNIK